MNEIGGTLRVGCGGENGPRVLRKDLQPRCDIGGVVFAGFEGNFQVGANKSGAEFRNEFFDRIGFAAETVTAEISIKALLMSTAVRSFMGQGSVITVCVTEALEGRKLDCIIAVAVESAVSAVVDGCAGGGEELLGALDAGDGVKLRFGLRVKVRGQAFDLLDVENRVALEKGNFALGLVAGLPVGFGAGDAVGVDHKRAFLTLADMRAEFDGLPERHPDWRGEVLRRCGSPQRKHVDSGVGLTIVPQGARDAAGGMLGVPWAHPWPDAFFEGSDNLRGDAAVNILPLIVLVQGPLLLLVSGFRETLGSNRAGRGERRVTRRGNGQHGIRERAGR